MSLSAHAHVSACTCVRTQQGQGRNGHRDAEGGETPRCFPSVALPGSKCLAISTWRPGLDKVSVSEGHRRLPAPFCPRRWGLPSPLPLGTALALLSGPGLLEASGLAEVTLRTWALPPSSSRGALEEQRPPSRPITSNHLLSSHDNPHSPWLLRAGVVAASCPWAPSPPPHGDSIWALSPLGLARRCLPLVQAG